MSRNVTHNRSPEQRTANHEKRLLALERQFAQGATGGIPALRDALYRQAGTFNTRDKSRNFDPGLATGTATIGSGGTRWCACYWPGGICTGMTFLLTTPGSYTDTTPNSGGAVYSYDGTTLTRQATQPHKWDSFSSGINTLNWGTALFLATGLYYVAIRYFASASTTVPVFGALTASDPSVWGGDTSQIATPSGYPIVFTSSGASAQLPATQAASGLTQGVAALPYAGLF